jgi:hypothetical protein
MDLARKARELGWWRQYDDLNLDPYIGLEEAASSITCFSMYYVPALMQTEDYAEGIIKRIAPGMDPQIHQQRIEVRLRRQKLLEQDSRPRYRVLLDEAVLHRRVGGPATMATQLEKILRLEREDRATVQVIPFDVGAHAAQDSNFVLLEFNESASPVVFVEGLTSNQYHERKADIARYREAVERLRDSALTPRDSVLLAADMRETYLGKH